MIFTRFICGIAFFMAAPVALAEISPSIVPLGDFHGIRTVSVNIARQPQLFLLDTGGGVTSISPALAENAKCRPWARIVGHRMTGEPIAMPRCDDLAIEIGGQGLIVPSAGVFDFTPLLPPNSGHIKGLIGLDVLAARPFTLELVKGRLTFETPRSLARRTARALEVPIRLDRQAGGLPLAVMIPVSTAAGLLWMQLDSGSDAALQVAPSSAQALGLKLKERNPPISFNIRGKRQELAVAEAAVRVRDINIDGNIGAPLMSRWMLTFDLRNEKLWIQPASES